jgi:tetratricopeptide (TPR) repeat protein
MGRVSIPLLVTILLATEITRAQGGRSAAEWVEALSEFTAAIAGTYGDEGTRINAALDRMAALPRPSDPLQQVEMAIRLEPQRADLYVRRGLLFDASGSSMDADAAFRQAWQLSAGNPITAYHVFRRAAKNGDAHEMQRARESLAAAYRTLLQDKSRTKASPFADINVVRADAADSPVLPPVAYAPGYDLIARGEYSDAIAVFRKAVDTDPLVTDPALRSPAVTQAITAAKQGRLADARVQLEGAPALRNSSEAHRLLGTIDWANGQDDKGFEQLRMAIRLNPRDERARLALASVLSSSGRDADAERALHETIQVWPDSALAHWWLGSIYDRTNRLADARREFALAAPHAIAGRAQFFTKIGQLATTAADIPGAVDAFTRAVSANLNDPEAHKRLAGAFILQDLTDEVFVELVAALLIDPQDAGAHAGIGQVHVNAGRYDEAVPALRRALELSPDYTEARYALATALMRLGKTQEAARELERVQQAQRQELEERRRTMSRGVLEEDAKAKAKSKPAQTGPKSP